MLPDEYLVRFTDTPQGRIRSRSFGQFRPGAPPVVALMGMAVSDYLVPGVAELSAWTRSHLVDLPGLGGSGPATRRLDVPGYAEAISEWLDRAEPGRVVLVGNSSSTQVAAHVARARPDRVAALVLASPTVDPRYRTWPRVLLRWRLDARHPMPGLQQQHTPEWVRAGPRRLVHLVSVHLRDDPEPVLAEVRCPVLVLRGVHDGLSRRAWATRLAATAARGSFRDMPGPHSFAWSDPAAWSAPIREFATAATAEPRR